MMDAAVLFALSVFSTFGFYALLAWGLGLIFGQLHVVNVAHGDMAMPWSVQCTPSGEVKWP